jgi:hypothetical protein
MQFEKHGAHIARIGTQSNTLRPSKKQKRVTKGVHAGGTGGPRGGRPARSTTRLTSENGLFNETIYQARLEGLCLPCVPGIPDSPPRPGIIPSPTLGACSQHDYANANLWIVSFLHQTQKYGRLPTRSNTRQAKKSRTSRREPRDPPSSRARLGAAQANPPVLSYSGKRRSYADTP